MDSLFKIFKLDAAEAQKIKTSVNEPHNHDFEELIIGRQGQLEHFIDFQSQLIVAPFICFVTRGKIHRVRPQPKGGLCDMWVLRFKTELVPEIAFQLYASFHEDANIPIVKRGCFERLEIICQIICDEFHEDAPDIGVIRQLLSTLLTMIESERRKMQQGNEEVKKIHVLTFRNFLHVLEENYKKQEGVNFYADKLFMSIRNLNLICQAILQQSVSEIIETRKLVEAKNLLITSGMTISEIGYHLGYKEKTYFTHVFKKKAGMTPSEFRMEMTRLIS